MGFRYTYKSVLKFRCDPSYDLIGDLETTCQADRSWSRPYPRCQGKNALLFNKCFIRHYGLGYIICTKIVSNRLHGTNQKNIISSHA